MIVCIDSSTIPVSDVERINFKGNEYYYLTTTKIAINNPLIKVAKVVGKEEADIFFTFAKIAMIQKEELTLISRNKMVKSLINAGFSFTHLTSIMDFVHSTNTDSIMSSIGVEISSGGTVNKRTTNHMSTAFDFVRDKKEALMDLDEDEEQLPDLSFDSSYTANLLTEDNSDLSDDIMENLGKSDLNELMSEEIEEKKSPKWFGSVTGLKGFDFKDEDVDFSNDDDLNDTKAMKMLNREDIK